MPCPIKLYKKVNIIFISHIMVTTSVITFVAYPILPEYLQLGFDSVTENLVTIGESIQFQLDHLSDSLISLVKWAHRQDSIYPYDPCTDSKLKTRIKWQQMNRQTDWESIISEYKLEMCKRAVGIIGQENEQNYKKIEGQGLEDNSTNIFNLHASSVGTGVGILIVLILIFKIIKHLNVQSCSAIL